MCDLCDDPEMTMDGYLDHLCERLTRERFVVQGVLGSRTSAEYSYTIGLTAQGLPELIVVGVRPPEAHRLLVSCGEYVLDESIVLPGEGLCSGRFTLEAVEVTRPTDHLVLAGVLYGEAVRALQLAWADERGRWPWDPRHRARQSGQPLLGERAPVFCDEHRPDRLDVPSHL